VSTMKRTRVTLRDVARRLDVHPSTVSRVLNPRTRSMVADAMAERVMEAVEDMGYRPNPFAYSLKTNRSFIIGVLIPDITDPLFPPIIQGVERTMAAAGYTTILADTDNDPERQRVNFDIMRERQVDGLIIATARYEDPVIEEARSGDIPMILVIRTIADPEMPCVINDDAHGIGVVAHGKGSSFLSGEKANVPLQMGTLSKAVGVYGGYLCASRNVVDFIRTRARSFIYTTGLPPSAVAASIAALELIETDAELVEKPVAKARLFTRALNLPDPESCIVPLVLGKPEKALKASLALEEKGFLVTAIRPPTVPQGTARLRFTFTAGHEDADILRLAEAVRPFKPGERHAAA